MSERGRQVLLGGLVVIAASPVFSFLLWPASECLHAMGQVGVWLAGGAKVGLVLAASSLLAWAARLAWLVHADAGLSPPCPRAVRCRRRCRPPCAARAWRGPPAS